VSGPSFSFGPKNSKALLFPFREICTHSSTSRDPSSFSYRGIGTRSFASSLSIFGLSNPRDPMCQSTLTFSLRYRDFALSLFATRDTNHSGFQPPIPDAPKCRNSRSRSLATSPLARPNDSYLDSRCPRRRTSDGLCHLSSTISCGPHYLRSCRNIASRYIATSVE
jgi:hypothetical protein